MPATQMVLVLLSYAGISEICPGVAWPCVHNLVKVISGPGLRADSLITCNDQGQCDGPTQ
jgi:hypothetical protein